MDLQPTENDWIPNQRERSGRSALEAVTVRAGRGGQGPPVPGLRRRHRTLALDRRSPARSATAHSSPAAFLEARRLRRCPVGRLRLEVAVARLGCDHDVADLPEQAKRPHGAQQRRQALRHSSPKACAAPCAGRGQPIGGVSMACRERPRCWERLAQGLRRWGEALALPGLHVGSGAQRRGDLRAASLTE